MTVAEMIEKLQQFPQDQEVQITDGYPNEERMRNLFWYYLNYGNTNTYYD